MIVTLPIPGFVSVVGFAVLWLAGDGGQLSPSLPLGQVHFALFLFGKLLVGNEFFHGTTSLLGGGIVAEKKTAVNRDDLPPFAGFSLYEMLIIDFIDCFNIHIERGMGPILTAQIHVFLF